MDSAVGRTPGIMQLVAENHLLWKRRLQQALTPVGLTLKQYYLLAELGRRGQLYPMDIADLLYCDRPTASVVIRALARRGWVSREVDQADARHIRVVLTARGRDKLEAVRSRQPLSARSVGDPLACFSADERATLARLLTTLHTHLEGLTSGTDGDLEVSEHTEDRDE